MTACIELILLVHLHLWPVQLYSLSLWQPHMDSLLAMIPDIGHPFVLVVKQNGYIHGNPSLLERANTYTFYICFRDEIGAHLDTLKVARTLHVSQYNHHINACAIRTKSHFCLKSRTKESTSDATIQRLSLTSYINKEGVQYQ